MTHQELRETLAMRKSKIDDPDFEPKPSPMKELLLAILAGFLIAVMLFAGIGWILK